MANLRYLVPLTKFNLYNKDADTDGNDNLRVTVNGQNLVNLVVFLSSRDKSPIFASFYTTSLEQLFNKFIADLQDDDKEVKHAITQSSSWEGVDTMSSLVIGRSKNGVCYIKLSKNGESSPAFKFTKYRGKDMLINGESMENKEASIGLITVYLHSLIRVVEVVTTAIAMKDAIEKPNDRNFGGGDNNSETKKKKSEEMYDDDIPF